MSRTICILVVAIIILFVQESYAEEHVLEEQENGYRISMYEDVNGYRYHLLNENGKQIGVNYSFVGQINNGHVIVGEEQSYGIMDLKGNITVTPAFVYIQYMNCSTYCAYNDNGLYIITESGNCLAFWENAEPEVIYDDYVIFSCQSGIGLLRVDGQLLLEPIWDSVSIPCCGVVRASSEYECVYYDDSGDIVFQCQLGMNYSDNAAFVVDNQQNEMFIDTNGSILFTSSEDKLIAGDFVDELCVACSRDSRKYGYIGKDGQWVIPPIYDYAIDFCYGYGVVIVSDRYGLINPKGNTVIECKYDMLFVGEDSFVSVKKDGQCGVINTQNNIIYPMIWDDIGIICEGYCAVEKDNCWGFIDQNGELTIPCQFYCVENFKNGKTVVEDFNHRKWIIDTKGAIIAPALRWE